MNSCYYRSNCIISESGSGQVKFALAKAIKIATPLRSLSLMISCATKTIVDSRQLESYLQTMNALEIAQLLHKENQILVLVYPLWVKRSKFFLFVIDNRYFAMQNIMLYIACFTYVGYFKITWRVMA